MKNTTKNKMLVVPSARKTTKKGTKSAPKIKHSPIDYYNCLLTYASQDWHDHHGTKKKITACCKDCKHNAPVLRKARDQEIKKVISAYQQMGDSLQKLLKPVN